MALTDKYVSSLASGGGDGSSGNPYTWAEMVSEINGGSAAGTRYNVKADGTYSLSSDQTITGNGTATSPIVIRGYHTTPGDGYQGRAFDGTGPLIDTNMPMITNSGGMIFGHGGSNAQYTILESLKMIRSHSGGRTVMTGRCGVVTRCIVQHSATGSSENWPIQMLGELSAVIDCDLEQTSGGNINALRFQHGYLRIVGNRIRSQGGAGIEGSNHGFVVGNVVYGCGSHGMFINSGIVGSIVGNTFVGNAGSGIAAVAALSNLGVIANNLITDNTLYGIDGNNAATALFALHNRIDRNGSGATNLATDWLAASSYSHNTTSILQSAEYVDATNHDYRLKSSSPAIGAGMGGTVIGALPQIESAAGGRRMRGRYIGI